MSQPAEPTPPSPEPITVATGVPPVTTPVANNDEVLAAKVAADLAKKAADEELLERNTTAKMFIENDMQQHYDSASDVTKGMIDEYMGGSMTTLEKAAKAQELLAKDYFTNLADSDLAELPKSTKKVADSIKKGNKVDSSKAFEAFEDAKDILLKMTEAKKTTEALATIALFDDEALSKMNPFEKAEALARQAGQRARATRENNRKMERGMK